MIDKKPFSVEISRIIELFASQIYPTPYAFLRENVQNSSDAILLRKHQVNGDFNPEIIINIEPHKIRVSDNGIGMTKDELNQHFWRAGSSSKNNPAAKAAGVVGTFGIGAMANFGIAEELNVESESAKTFERTSCYASKSTLSVTENCIIYESKPSLHQPGTTIIASIQQDKSVNVTEAIKYISHFISYLKTKVIINGVLESQKDFDNAIPKLAQTWSHQEQGKSLGSGIIADIFLQCSFNGEIRVKLSNIYIGGVAMPGEMILKQALSSIQTYRSGFGLAPTIVSSAFAFGGVADFMFLQPTAGREALTTESNAILQKIVHYIEEPIATQLSEHSEAHLNSYFIQWASRTRRYDLCSNLKIRLEPGNLNVSLGEAKEISKTIPLLVYDGNDPTIIGLATEEKKMVLLSNASSRKDCEINYLLKYCKIEQITNAPRVVSVVSDKDLSSSMKALQFRIEAILSQDYFLPATIKFGTISSGLPVFVQSNKKPVDICIDKDSSSIQILLNVYDGEYMAFPHMTKDYIRNVVFPKIKDMVPSATRQGAEAFLKVINKSREIFEVESDDLEYLNSLWDDYLSGKVTRQALEDAPSRIAVRSTQTIEATTTGRVSDIIPDVVQNDVQNKETSINTDPAPAIERRDIPTNSKLLIIDNHEPALKHYRCFLSITDKVREERGDFFLQPHKTSVVWGGQKVLFIFEHHSGRFGLYYDLQMQNLIGSDSGGGTFETCTIIMKNKIFIPIPESIQANFIPNAGEKRKFEVRCDLLYID